MIKSQLFLSSHTLNTYPDLGYLSCHLYCLIKFFVCLYDCMFVSNRFENGCMDFDDSVFFYESVPVHIAVIEDISFRSRYVD